MRSFRITGLAVTAALIAVLWTGIGSAASPPYAPWMNRPATASVGQTVTYRLHIRNNLDRPLQIQGGLSYLTKSKGEVTGLSIGGWFPVESSNIPFNNDRGMCGCLGKPWIFTVASHQVKSYFFTVRLKKEGDFCPVASLYAPGLHYSLDTSHNKCTAIEVVGTA